MNVLYKYYSALEPSYFDNPTLKLSQPKKLNDPFESAVQFKLLRSNTSLRQVLKKHPIFKSDEINIDNAMLKSIAKKIASCGVVSLSETHRNILMWAHYADEHRGLCIGYHTNGFETSKINYDSSRYDPIDDHLNIGDFNIWTNQVAKKILTTKSDEWIYEKEHRIIHPINQCDYFISNKMLKHNEYTREIYHAQRLTKMIILENGSKRYVPTKSWDNSSEYFFNLQENNDLTFFKEISPTQIKSIFLGYRYPEDKKNSLLKKVHDNNSKIRDVKIYKMTLCQYEFKLKPIEIYPEN